MGQVIYWCAQQREQSFAPNIHGGKYIYPSNIISAYVDNHKVKYMNAYLLWVNKRKVKGLKCELTCRFKNHLNVLLYWSLLAVLIYVYINLMVQMLPKHLW